MVHVREQKTPVTKMIYATYEKKNQHNKCRHKERKKIYSSLSTYFLTYFWRLFAIHLSLLRYL